MRKMKDSGIEWIGEIPEDWETKRLKFLASICNGQDYKNVQVDDGGYPVMGSGGEFAYASKYLYNKPSVLLGRKGTVDKPLYVDSPFWAVDTMYYTDIKDGVLPKFFYYLSLNIKFDLYQYGSAVPSMTQRDLNEITMPVPNIIEQRQIVRHLDSKWIEIDFIIESKVVTNEKLKQYRQSIIYEAVTKGLDKSVPMKDSGIEWIGEMPEQWDKVRIKYTGNYQSGTAINGAHIYEEGIFEVYGGNGVRGYSNEFTHKKGEYILIGRQGALCGNVQYVNTEFWATEHAIVGLINKIYSTRYMYYTLLSMNLNQYSESAAQPGLSVERITNLSIVFPSDVKEQQRIADYLDKKCSEIDSVIEANVKIIEKLKEYRQSVIYEAVTGKKEI